MSGRCAVVWTTSATSQRSLSTVLTHIQSHQMQNSMGLGLGGMGAKSGEIGWG